jgi:hypothetical protein
MVVIETESQIVEITSHEMAAAQHSNTAHHFNNGKCSLLFFVQLSYTFPNRERQ